MSGACGGVTVSCLSCVCRDGSWQLLLSVLAVRSDGVILTWSIQNRPHSHSSKHQTKYSGTSGGWSSPGLATWCQYEDIWLIFPPRLASTLMIISRGCRDAEKERRLEMVGTQNREHTSDKSHNTHSTAKLIKLFVFVVVVVVVVVSVMLSWHIQHIQVRADWG